MNTPECLAHLPVDQRRNLPIPFVHQCDDGRWDFTVLIDARVQECIRDKLCGGCGRPLGWWCAFVGGPVSAHTRVYTDPPMHEDCARGGVALCPHVNRANMKRAKHHHLGDATTFLNNDEAILDRPSVWVLTVCRTDQVQRVWVPSGRQPLFRAGTIKRMSGWINKTDQPGLIPLGDKELAAAIEDAKVRNGLCR